ncbi:MAG: response regulator [Angelakisella sp.]
MYSILIVDDELPAIEGITSGVSWKRLGIGTVLTAMNPRQAREQFAAQPIDLLLCDIEMPQESGIQLLSWVREHSPQTISILLTCHADFEYAKDALALGAFDYLLKPTPYDEVERVLQKALCKLGEEREKQEYYRYGEHWVNNRSLVEEQFWQELLGGGIPADKEKIGRQAQKRNVTIDLQAQYRLLLCSVRQWSKPPEDWEQRNLDYAIKNVLSELFYAEQTPFLIVSMEVDHKAMLLPLSGKLGDKDSLRECCGQYIAAAKKYFSCNVCFYCGTPCGVAGLLDTYTKLMRSNRDNEHYQQGVFFEDELPLTQRAPQAINSVNRYIEEHLSEELSREELAEQVYLNPAYLSRLYHKETGESISEHIARVRMDRIKEYLSHTDLSISAIAYQVGYTNLPYFSKLFRKETGMTPLEYRKKSGT